MKEHRFLRISGWGPFPLPGEQARLSQLEKEARELFDTKGEASVRTEDHVGTGQRRAPGHTNVAREGPRADEARKSANANLPDDDSRVRTVHQKAVEIAEQSPRILGGRKLYYTPGGPMQGQDVRELQDALRGLGYAEIKQSDGVFAAETEAAVKHFQRDYGVRDDGVCGRVTFLVLNRLRSLAASPVNPVSTQDLAIIRWATAAQHGGFIMIDPIYSPVSGDVSVVNDLLTIVRDKVEKGIEQKLVLPTLHSQGKPEGDAPYLSAGERARFADSIRAELVIALSVRDDSDSGDGIATFYTDKGGAVTEVGRTLATYLLEELTRLTGTADLGVHVEQASTEDVPKVPSVRVEIGNIEGVEDRERLLADGADGGYLDLIAQGVTIGVKRLYSLGARKAPIGDNPVGELTGRNGASSS